MVPHLCSLEPLFLVPPYLMDPEAAWREQVWSSRGDSVRFSAGCSQADAHFIQTGSGAVRLSPEFPHCEVTESRAAI